MSSETTKVPHPITGKGDSKSQERITIIDLSGAKRFRQRSWPDYYKKIHGLIFVIDASEKKSMTENKETLEDLLENEDLKDKPILM
jgi:GTPase SAR1 family protein